MCTALRGIRDEVRIACRSVVGWSLLAVGLGNLFTGIVFGVGDWVPTFHVLDITYANFGFTVWAAVIFFSGHPPPAPTGLGLVAKTLGLGLVALAMLTVAGLAGLAIQLCRSSSLDLLQHARGLYANFGWGTAHLAMLAVATQAIVGRPWLGIAATVALWGGSNLCLEHTLLGFGAPVSPASGMNGFGPFLPRQVAAGIYWTGFCIALLAAGRWVARRRSATADGPPLPPPGPNAFAVVWTATVAWMVSGGWILYSMDTDDDTAADLRTRAKVMSRRHAALGDIPQPVYSRLDLNVEIRPAERSLASRGTGIAINRLDVPIPEIHFSIPRTLTVEALTLTGDLVSADAPGGYRRYRLNRPLEPRETLKIAFALQWNGPRFEPATAHRILANGTSVSTSDVVPAMGLHASPFERAPPVAFRARISTSLDQVAITAGTLVGVWKENGRSFFEYESEVPVHPLTTIHSGSYVVARERWNNVDLEVFHHPAHRDNVPRTIEAARRTLAQWNRAEPYPHSLLRLVEVPDYQPFRRVGIGSLGTKTNAPTAAPRGMVWPYSERGRPFSTPPPTESTRRRASGRRRG